MVAPNLENMRLREEITERAARYLVTEKPRTPQMYLLLKIHKTTNPIPGRPIVSAANESLTERISAFVDHFLSPIVQTVRSYIRDMDDYLLKLQEIDNLKMRSCLPWTCQPYTPTSPMKRGQWQYYGHSARRDLAKPNRVVCLWWSCWHKSCYSTTSNLMGKITFRLEEQPWTPGWHPRMPTFS